jgi:hypothetical protein
LVLVQALSVGLYALWMTMQTSDKLSLVSSEYLPEMELAAQVEREVLNARIHFVYFVTVQKAGSLEKGWERFRRSQQQLAKLQALVERSADFAALRPDLDQLRRDFASYEPVLERIIDTVKRDQNRGPEYTALLNEWARLGGVMVDSAGRLSHRGAQLTDASAMQASSRRATLTLAGACLAGLLFGAALTFFFMRSIDRDLRTIVRELGDASSQVAGAALQIAGSAQSLSQDASEQAASLEETSASSEHVNSLTNRNAENSRSAAGNMGEASQRIEEANFNLDSMVAAMKDISASSEKIAKIIQVIDDISFQTNILALNASVEAARAGEAGLGFAVVAGEVRNLAQRCAQAAKDTAGLIEDSIAKSADGQIKLHRVTTAVYSITESATNVRTILDDVKNGSEEQARGIEQVTRALTQIEKLTQRTAANAKKSAAAGEELSAQSETLRDVVTRLSSMAGGA